MNVALSSDHRGFAAKESIKAFLEDAGIALVGTGASFDLLDSLGRDADSLAARALAELN